MINPMEQLRREHAARQVQRLKMRLPVTLVTVAVSAAGIFLAIYLASGAHSGLGVAVGVSGAVLAALWYLSAQLLGEWDRAVVLRLGRFHRVRGPGFFMIVPILQSTARVVDMRIRTTSFYGESMLTKDTVPVEVDAIAFWHVWDAQKAVLEVERYYQAITMTVQTALRDIVGVHMLAEILAEREQIGQRLQKVLAAKVEAWGINVNSIEIRDIMIPDNLKDALSKQAQAERERQARTILGQAEIEIAEKYADASKGYLDNPIALQLRAMNIIYEGLRAGNSIMLVPASVLDTMNLGSFAAMGVAEQAKGNPRHSMPPSTAS